MFVASAAYNACYPSLARELLRRADHAMIFVMIAGTCTPFALFSTPFRALALIMGWTMFGMGWAYADNLPNVALLLLFGGGIAYSCGALVHALGRVPFHNVAWHGSVLLGAGLHWAAVANQIVYSPGL